MPAVFDRDQVARVEGLLATVHELTSTLRRTSEELGREVARALYLDGAGGGSEAEALEVENDRLRHAVQGRAVIEQATGMVMAVRGCNAGEAVGVLTALARAGDRTLREVAADVVATSFREPDQSDQTGQPDQTGRPALPPWGTAAGETTDADKADRLVIDVRTPSPYAPEVPAGPEAEEPQAEPKVEPETEPQTEDDEAPSLDPILRAPRPQLRRLNPFSPHRR